jgi:ABC-type bacteriocin/lantibiotic exporter with double-glycine peptidase domain
LFYFVALIIFSPYAALLLGGILFLIAACMIVVFKKASQIGKVQIEMSRKLNSFFIESVGSVKTLRSFSAGEYVGNIYSVEEKRYMFLYFLVEYLQVLIKLIPVVILVFISICMVFLFRKSFELIEFQYFVSLLIYIFRFLPLLGNATNICFKLIADSKSNKDLVSYLKEVDRHESSEKNITYDFLDKINTINIKGLSFGYDKVLTREVSINMVKGEIYCFMGESGIGKSTLLDVLLRYLEPKSGTVEINGKEMHSYSALAIRSKISLLEQRIPFFSDSIENNISLGFKFSSNEYAAVLKKTKLADFIYERNKQGDFNIHYQGTNLSGGQKQRLGLARLLLRDPEVILLDETFVGLDNATKFELLNEIKAASRDKITIIVTHDKDVLSIADKIVMLERMS